MIREPIRWPQKRFRQTLPQPKHKLCRLIWPGIKKTEAAENSQLCFKRIVKQQSVFGNNLQLQLLQKGTREIQIA